MNEAETRAELIEPALKAAGWGVVDASRILREYHITEGRIQPGGRGKKEIADFVLVYKGIKLAVVEAKRRDLPVGEGVMQAKNYAHKMQLETTYSTNGLEIYQICMKTGTEGLVNKFLSPNDLWQKTFSEKDDWRDKFTAVPFEDKSGSWEPRYYQDIAVQKTMEAIAAGKDRILLTLATGTGKTAIAFQIAWKLFQSRWNLKRDGARRPRILFLADRNILADQAFNSFSSFSDDSLVRIKPDEIKKRGKVPTNGSIFFTIFQTFMSGTDSDGNPAPYFGEYPADYFDFIIIDECHRGGANDESNWRGIMEYFSPAVQLGLTATPKLDDNVNTYRYFGEPVFVYSLKDGINDGFLTPFKVKRIQTTLDNYVYTPDDIIMEGEIEEGKIYEEKDFNRIIEIKEREVKRVKVFLDNAVLNEKAIIFCANQGHAALIRDLVNQNADSDDPFYCVRVTADDGESGEQKLRDFQDNDNSIPTILTTSHKLSTGVDARNIRNIVLLRPINSMIEFKQIIGRGTRLFDGKEFFTIYDFVDAYKHFYQSEWDGDPYDEESSIYSQNSLEEQSFTGEEQEVFDQKPDDPFNKKQKIKVKLRDGKEREIQHMVSTSFWSTDGKPISAEEFIHNLFGELPKLFSYEDELRKIWSNPSTRKTLLEKLDEAGFPKSALLTLQKLADMEKCDLYDVLSYVFNGDFIPMTREERAKAAETTINASLNEKERDFISFVLNNYIKTGIDELEQDKLPVLLINKFHSLEDAKASLGDAANISRLFLDFQKHLYTKAA